VSKREEYRAKAAEHSQLAETCQSKEAREIHRDLAEWFLLLADDRWFDPIPHTTAFQPAPIATDHAQNRKPGPSPSRGRGYRPG
jgi:hypothetical protein